MTQKRKFELDSRQSARLLDLGLHVPAGNDDPVDPDERRQDLLYQILTAPLPLPDQTRESLPPVLQGQSQDLQTLAGQPIGELIQNATVELALIKRIKEFTKEQGAATESKETRDAFMAVYLGSIACALVYHGERISQHSPKDLKGFFDTFAKKPWVLAELQPLFGRASQQLDP